MASSEAGSSSQTQSQRWSLGQSTFYQPGRQSPEATACSIKWHPKKSAVGKPK